MKTPYTKPVLTNLSAQKTAQDKGMAMMEAMGMQNNAIAS